MLCGPCDQGEEIQGRRRGDLERASVQASDPTISHRKIRLRIIFLISLLISPTESNSWRTGYCDDLARCIPPCVFSIYVEWSNAFSTALSGPNSLNRIEQFREGKGNVSHKGIHHNSQG